MKLQSTHPQAFRGRTTQIILICVLCMGIGLLWLAGRLTIELIQLHLFGHEARGRVIRQDVRLEQIVVGSETDTGGRRRDIKEEAECYYAVVSFRTDEGTFTIEAYDAGVRAPQYPTDSAVTVVYRSGHPDKARIKQEISGLSGIFGPLMLTVFGLVLTGIGGVPLLLSLKRQRETLSSSTRYQVGALVTYQTQYMLVHYIERVPGAWDFPHVEIEYPAMPPRTGLVQMLQEFTGSQHYVIRQEFDAHIVTESKTMMFLVEYTGDGTDISPHREEIDQVQFFSSEEVCERLLPGPLKTFFQKHISTPHREEN